MSKDIRWKQRFNNYVSALRSFTEAVELSEERELSELEKKGMIQDFEVTIELSWKVLKDYFEEQGMKRIESPKSVIKEAFRQNLIEDGQIWINMLDNRNKTSHIYDAGVLIDLYEAIIEKFYPEFVKLSQTFTPLYEKTDG